jgi:hypothetical protein
VKTRVCLDCVSVPCHLRRWDIRSGRSLVPPAPDPKPFKELVGRASLVFPLILGSIHNVHVYIYTHVLLFFLYGRDYRAAGREAGSV